MKIAIDCRPIAHPDNGLMAGIGQYAAHLVRHLLRQDEDNRYVLFFDEAAGKSLMAEMLGSNRNATARVLPLCRYKKFLPYAYSHHVVASAIARERADVYHAVTGSLPLGYRGTSVVTVADLAIYLHPEWFPGGQLLSRRVVVPASLRRAARVIAVSRATALDIERLFAVPKEKIRVIHEGVDPPSADEREAHSGLVPKNPYLLFLGTVEPRKNIDGLVEAFVSLAEKFPKLVEGVDLLIAGADGWKSEPIFRRIRAANRALGGERIRHLGYVPAKDKTALMAHCLAFLFPSRYEGFGLPALEAMSLGRPVVAGNRGGIPEFASRAALLIDPDDRAELIMAMKHLLEDPAKREALGRKGWERALEFRWERTAGETIEVYEEAVRSIV